jgi:peptide/nickel transport system substrate-binding protein
MQFGGNSLQSSMWKFYDYTMHSRYAKTNMWWSTTASNYKSGDIDKWIADLGLTQDEAEQKMYASKIERYFADNVVQIPLYYNGVWYEYNDTRFTGFANADNPFVHPAPWDGMSRIIHVNNLEPR